MTYLPVMAACCPRLICHLPSSLSISSMPESFLRGLGLLCTASAPLHGGLLQYVSFYHVSTAISSLGPISLLLPSGSTGDKSINYSIPDHIMPYSAHSICAPVPFAPDEFGHATGAMTPSDVSSSISPPNGQMGNTKYSTSIPGDRIAAALGQEEGVRVAAEEDRRRRNTAASARFRMKKKQREQALERTVRETTEKNASLEARVAQLEMENRWLKNLLTEKHEASATRSMPAPPKDSSALEGKSNGARSSGQKHTQPRKTGVGTDV